MIKLNSSYVLIRITPFKLGAGAARLPTHQIKSLYSVCFRNKYTEKVICLFVKK